MNKSGRFYVFEGLDGSGKTTLIKEVHARIVAVPSFRENFSDISLLKEPSDSPEGLEIKRKLKASQNPDRREWLNYFQEDRAINVRQNIKPLLAKNHLILQDRYYFSTAAYQGDIQESPTCREIIEQSRDKKFPSPDRIFYLNIKPEVALARLKSSRRNLETFETLVMLNRIAIRYRLVLPAETVILNGNCSVAELAGKVIMMLQM